MYLFISTIEIILYVYARLPPPLYALTNTSKLVIGISALLKALLRFGTVAEPGAFFWPKLAVDVVLLYV